MPTYGDCVYRQTHNEDDDKPCPWCEVSSLKERISALEAQLAAQQGENVRLKIQYEQAVKELGDAHRVLWILVRARGGVVTVTRNVMAESSRGSLSVHLDPATLQLTIRALDAQGKEE
jgi:hypothetical protein